MSDESLIAVFVDYENLAIGVRDAKIGRFRMDLVLKRLLEKGRIVYKRASSRCCRVTATSRRSCTS